MPTPAITLLCLQLWSAAVAHLELPVRKLPVRAAVLQSIHAGRETAALLRHLLTHDHSIYPQSHCWILIPMLVLSPQTVDEALDNNLMSLFTGANDHDTCAVHWF